jgi:hypothetical protein
MSGNVRAARRLLLFALLDVAENPAPFPQRLSGAARLLAQVDDRELHELESKRLRDIGLQMSNLDQLSESEGVDLATRLGSLVEDLYERWG